MISAAAGAAYTAHAAFTSFTAFTAFPALMVSAAPYFLKNQRTMRPAVQKKSLGGALITGHNFPQQTC